MGFATLITKTLTCFVVLFFFLMGTGMCTKQARTAKFHKVGFLGKSLFQNGTVTFQVGD